MGRGIAGPPASAESIRAETLFFRRSLKSKKMCSMALSRPDEPAAVDAASPAILWVDGVGGFLLWTASRAVIGGPAAEADGTIAVGADLRRREAILERTEAGYGLRPADGRVSLAERTLERAVTLRDGETFTLGRSTRFTFGKPQPLSGSARLSVLPPARFRGHIDAVLMVDDTLLVGPRDDCHVVAPQAEGKLVLMRRQGTWQVKNMMGSGVWQPLTAGQAFREASVSMSLEEQ